MAAGYGDIIFFAVVAAFLVLKLIGVLGRKDSDEEIDTIVKRHEQAKIAYDERVASVKNAKQQKQLPQTPVIQTAEPEVIDEVDFANDSIKDTIELIKTKDPQFSVNSFVIGSKAAFDMVMKAFSNNDRETLKLLLSDDLYSMLSKVLDENIATNRKEEKSVVAIDAKTITAAELSGTVVKLRLNFISEQINLVKDKEGKLISGSPSRIEAVEDNWEFERNIRSSDPNWKITAIS